MKRFAVNRGSHIVSRRMSRILVKRERCDSEGEKMVGFKFVGGQGMMVGEENMVGI